MNTLLTVAVWGAIAIWASFMLSLFVGRFIAAGNRDDEVHGFYAAEGAWSDCDCAYCVNDEPEELDRFTAEGWAELADAVEELKAAQIQRPFDFERD